MSDWNAQVIEEFRKNGGKVGGMFEGADLLLLTTTGAKSGGRHTTPLGYLEDGGRVLVFASNAGGPKNPAWYHNVLADPRVTVEIGTRSYEALAVPLQGEERDEMYALQGKLVPAYADYQRQTDRVIPVVALTPAAAPRGNGIGDHLVRVHAELRRDLADLRAQIAAGSPESTLTARLRERCRTVCLSLGEHHANEDRVFPHLQEHAPELAPVLDRLRREHVAVARMKGELQALLDAGDPAGVRAELDRLAGELEAHFAYEEEQLLAALEIMPPPGR
ncbi:nitroreductase/quinone reductase family protein [Actinomadura macrotermitis]|uniref:Hemerythrin-like domain-containing protein n=1 Tax=Actinomadura macrotermitis TaxID=2585200 RepID=A0A7K0BNV1_9ACTN|nr:nitroreductase/quinone reductase family protein [Actinomadura macrotermitis]MQY02384.1 hypothetical protein [Actinomadura macrotermitis]